MAFTSDIEQSTWPLRGEERDHILRSLSGVGPQKMIGYLPLDTISVVLALTPEDVEAEAGGKGLVAIRFDPDACCIRSGAIYVYDREHLQDFLNRMAATLTAWDWPLDAESFVRVIAATWVETDDPIFPIISQAFADQAVRADRG